MLSRTHHYGAMQCVFTALQILCSAEFIHPHPQPLTTTDLFTVTRVVPFPECHVVGHTYVAFSNGLSLHNLYLSFSMFFHGLIAHFFLALNNIPLFECARVCLSIHLLKDVLGVCFSHMTKFKAGDSSVFPFQHLGFHLRS